MESFAGIEDTLNRAASAALANARAQWRGLHRTGVYTAAYRDALGVVSAAPRFTCHDDDLDDLVPGDSLTVTYRGIATAYVVREVQPDGAGMLVLVLEAA